MSMDESFATYELALGATGAGRVMVNGEDVSHSVAGVEVHAAPGRGTVLRLHMKPGVASLAGDGIIHIVEREASLEGMADWLAAVDVSELDRLALDEVEGGESLTATALRILSRWARGAA